jgi:hypothetical protein
MECRGVSKEEKWSVQNGEADVQQTAGQGDLVWYSSLISSVATKAGLHISGGHTAPHNVVLPREAL